jgi:hypothetical protein
MILSRAIMDSQSTLPMISACLWDLRTQGEAMNRLLMSAQRLTEASRDGELHGIATIRLRLHELLSQVLVANGVIAEAAAKCLQQIEQLPTSDSLSFSREN